MANRRKDRLVPAGFMRYEGEYDKAFYTIITFNGVRYEHIWPNGGTFNVGSKRLCCTDIFAIRKEVI